MGQAGEGLPKDGTVQYTKAMVPSREYASVVFSPGLLPSLRVASHRTRDPAVVEAQSLADTTCPNIGQSSPRDLLSVMGAGYRALPDGGHHDQPFNMYIIYFPSVHCPMPPDNLHDGFKLSPSLSLSKHFQSTAVVFKS